jgi:hypothetical protein
MAALALALDVKGAAYDVDVARLAKRKWVKISHTTFNYDNNAMLFDTVENNNGTPTDLTIDPYRLQLAAGFYVIQAKIIVPTSNATFNYYATLTGSGGASVTGAATTARDFGGTPSTWTPTTIGIMDAAYVATGTGKVALNLVYTGAGPTIPINYASLAAWWISDV